MLSPRQRITGLLNVTSLGSVVVMISGYSDGTVLRALCGSRRGSVELFTGIKVALTTNYSPLHVSLL